MITKRMTLKEYRNPFQFVPGAVTEPIRNGPHVRRNSLCPCGSGRKFKVCHLILQQGFMPMPAEAAYAEAE